MDLQELRAKLAKVEAEIADMGTTYSQSNPSYVLGMRSLRRIRERLIQQIDQLHIDQLHKK